MFLFGMSEDVFTKKPNPTKNKVDRSEKWNTENNKKELVTGIRVECFYCLCLHTHSHVFGKEKNISSPSSFPSSLFV